MRLSLVLLALPLLVACGGGENEPAKSPEAPGTAPSTTAAAVPERTTQLHRAGVKRTIARGLGYFLQDVTVEDYPVMTAGKFHGFRIKSVNADWGVDLRPGDVVTKVNGMSIEHPEDADAALRSLEKATSLKVDFDRDGKPQTLELPIVED